jgi:ABC-2 type transport system ATP-binding protein
MIRVEHLGKNYGEVQAVDDVSFNVLPGQLYSLLGPNGAGKSTTINILSCNLQPSVGDAFIHGFSVKDNASEVRKYIGICPQENVLYSHLTVLENLIFFGKMYDVPMGELKPRAEELIEKLGLKEKMHAKIEGLSGGQKRRVNLLVGLVHDPEILFLDEPTAGLDPQTRRLLWDYMEELKERKKTIILTTHYMDEADILSDFVGIIDHGKLIAENTPEKLKESIGKGDNLSFKLDGSKTAVQNVLDELLTSKEIVSAVPMEGESFGYHLMALDGIGKIGKIVNRFLEQKVKVEDISIRPNSLENVFLTLTGRNLRE